MSAPESIYEPNPGKSWRQGAIAWMAQNSVAANLLLFVLFVGGLLSIGNLKQEVFPDTSPELVTVSVPYPGASPEEVEQGIVLAVEEAARGVDQVKRITSASSEGVGTVNIELVLGADLQKALSDVKTEVDRITSFPEEAEEPSVTLASSKRQVISLLISGDQPLATLHDAAERARQRLVDHPEITQAELQGVPPLEIAVEIPRERLEAYNLTLDQVATQITLASLELPGGSVESRRGEILVRVADRRLEASQFEDIILRGTADGAQLRLGDIAKVTDGYAEEDLEAFYGGDRAVRVIAYRSGAETPGDVAAAAREVAAELRAELPPEIGVNLWQDDSEILKARVELLVRNAGQGLVLVVICLGLFLNARLAFWVAFGIPSAFFATFLVLPALGVSINMMSLFAFIVTLGIVVDDAIVVSENFWHKVESGVPPMEAAVRGAQEMLVPVSFSVLTTIAAFAPLLFVPGVSGRIFSIIPVVVISVLLFSVVECFTILPAHLGHGDSKKGWLLTQLDRPRAWVDVRLTAFTQGPYERFLRGVIEARYLAASVAFALFVLTIGVLGGGVVPFEFFPKLEGDLVTATVRLPYGTPVERTREIKAILERSADQAMLDVGDPSARAGMYAIVGLGPAPRGPGATQETGSHLLTVEMSLVSSDARDLSGEEIADAWEKATPPLPGIEASSFSASFGAGAGAAVDVQLSHTDVAVLQKAAAEMTATLRGYADLTDVENGFASGKVRLDLQLTDAARSLGLSSTDLGRQVRSAFFGAEALREQRGRDEVKVMVRLPEEQRRTEYDIEQLQVRTAAGGGVPIGAVASVTRGQAPTVIRREDGRRVVSVSGELAPGVPSSQEVVAAVKAQLPALMEKYPGLSAGLAGAQREQAETFGALGRNFLFGLFVIYALLAVPFRSYLQPAIVMVSIPMGFVGSIGGHLLHGYGLSIISVFGIIAASGVVVNDSLVLIDAVNTFRREEGMSAKDAVIAAGQRRMRPILLTSLTTFFGLIPLIFETSPQARFLIPMALSLAYGVAFTTFIALLLVPPLYMIQEDLQALVRWVKGGKGAAEANPAVESPATAG
ncbi:MAG: efflux RND transporter permease subunit [Deltaproteobacteria bacterium]|nr:efflux RND transporter permease subunit [Deltaproteobacteria bacterium]